MPIKATSKLERAQLLVQAHNEPKLAAALMEKCRRDPIFWMNNFCWTFDPRKTRQPDIPFILYDYQEWAVRQWIADIENQEDFGIEKSRDMGVSWLIVLVFQWFWLYRKGSNFHMGSFKEKYTDNGLIDPADTLFGKFRYNLYKLPKWMVPDVNDKKLSIQNTTTGNIITGEAASPDFGRGARKLAILFDELAFWDFGESAWAAASQTTNCRIALSTPFGVSNKYGKLMTDPKTLLIEHPEAFERMKAKGYERVAA